MGAKLLKRFCSDECGNLALVFGFAIIPFLMAAGVAVDYGRAVVAKHRLQVALDTAVLAAGSLHHADDQDRKALGKAFFEANFDASEHDMVVPDNLILIENNMVSASETARVKTWFMHLASVFGGSGRQAHDVEVRTQATALVPQVSKAEIALVLDYSGSMWDPLNGIPKFLIMRDAADDLIARVAAAANNPQNIQFSLVPFSYGVKARLKRSHLTSPQYYKLSGNARMESCVSGRKLNATSDAEPGDGKRHRWQQNDLWVDKGSENKDRADRCDRMLPLRELTGNTSVLNGDLGTWTPYGGTHISSGFQFGWHTISPNSVFEGGAAYDKVDHADPAERVYKAIVLLTDGSQTSPAYRKDGDGQNNLKTSDPRWPLNDTNGERNLEDLCTNAKAAGVVVVTVAFDLDDADTIARLDTCASAKDPAKPLGERYAYKADSTAELQSAFSQIGDILSEMVYLSN